MRRDVLVVGSGVVGLSTAYYLAKAGLSVTLAEADSSASGASGGNLGQISVIDRDQPFQLAWTLESLDLYRDFQENQGLDCELNQSGGLLLLSNEDQRSAGHSLMTHQRARGVPVSFVDNEEIRRMEPSFRNDAVLGALSCPLEGTLNPLKVVRSLRFACASSGVRLLDGWKITGFQFQGDRVLAAKTDRGDLAADLTVLATGSWTRELSASLGLDVPVYYHKGTALVTNPVPRTIRSVIVSGGFLTNRPISNRIVGLGVAQHERGSIVIGQATERGNNYDRTLSVEGVHETVKNFLRYFPSLAHLEIIRSWAANTTYTPDGRPAYGFSEQYSNLFFAAGLKGAFSTAPSAGKMAADLIRAGQGAAPTGSAVAQILKTRGLEAAEFDSMRPERRIATNG